MVLSSKNIGMSLLCHSDLRQQQQGKGERILLCSATKRASWCVAGALSIAFILNQTKTHCHYSIFLLNYFEMYRHKNFSSRQLSAHTDSPVVRSHLANNSDVVDKVTML